MDIKNNFPIKYAILPLKEEGGYSVNYQDIIRGYIVSKCWVIESSLKYISVDKFKIFHKVIFPYKNLTMFKKYLLHKENNIGPKVLPNSYNDSLLNTVLNLYDSYENAKKDAIEKNEVLRHELILNIPYNISDYKFKKILAELENDFKEQLSICQLFENNILFKTVDMNITENLKINNKLILAKTKNV